MMKILAAASICLALFVNSALAQQSKETAATTAQASPQPPADPSFFLDLRYADSLNNREQTWLEVFDPRDVRLLNSFGAVTLPLEDDILRGHLKLSENQGMVVTDVAPDTPAAVAGLVRGDVLLTIDDKPMVNQQSLIEALQTPKEYRIQLLRNGDAKNLRTPMMKLVYDAVSYRIGISATGAGDALRSQLRIPKDQGLVVTELVKDGPAARSGLQQHDVLVRINDQTLSSLDDLRRGVNASEGKEVTIDLIRMGRSISLPVTPEIAPELGLSPPMHALEYDFMLPAVFDFTIEPMVFDASHSKSQLDAILKSIDQLRDAVERLKADQPD